MAWQRFFLKIRCWRPNLSQHSTAHTGAGGAQAPGGSTPQWEQRQCRRGHPDVATFHLKLTTPLHGVKVLDYCTSHMVVLSVKSQLHKRAAIQNQFRCLYGPRS